MEFVDRNSRDFWKVSPTGEHQADFKQGEIYARQYLKSLSQQEVTPYFLMSILEQWPWSNLTSIEHGFSAEVSKRMR